MSEEVPVTSLKDAQQRRNQSLLANLKDKREAASNKETYITIPGYDGDPPILKAKYRLIDSNEIDKIATRVQKESGDSLTRQVLGAVDTLIAACDGFYVDVGDGELQPFVDPDTDAHVAGYNQDLANLLQYEANTAREVVFGLFSNNEIAIMQHNIKLSMWMSNTSRDVDNDFLGLV